MREVAPSAEVRTLQNTESVSELRKKDVRQRSVPRRWLIPRVVLRTVSPRQRRKAKVRRQRMGAHATQEQSEVLARFATLPRRVRP